MAGNIEALISFQRMKAVKKAELARDWGRIKLLAIRSKLKFQVEGNESKMDLRRLEHAKSLNPTSRLKTLAAHEWAKLVRNPSNWSSVPLKPKYSSVKPKPRVYGKRFEAWGKFEQGLPGQMPREYEEAVQKMAESISKIREDIGAHVNEKG
jgi:hypothetical protein